MKQKGYLAAFIIIGVLVIDQIIKIWVKTTMFLHSSIHITDWFQIFFTENNGMAFGMELFGKLFLTTFRIVAVILILWYLVDIIKRNLKTGYIVCIAMIASFVPVGEGYGSWFQGRVVDMFYFPIIDTHWPSWLPIWGGQHFIFFSPIFNFADASISCGIIALLLFYHKYLNASFGKKKEKKD